MTPDDPVPLSEAVRLFFPHGGATVSSLRTEARKGRLALERIAGKDFVTLRAIQDMRAKCRTVASQPASISGKEGAGPTPGSSSTERMKQAQAALEPICKALKSSSPSGSPRTRGPTPANVISIKSR